MERKIVDEKGGIYYEKKKDISVFDAFLVYVCQYGAGDYLGVLEHLSRWKKLY